MLLASCNNLEPWSASDTLVSFSAIRCQRWPFNARQRQLPSAPQGCSAERQIWLLVRERDLLRASHLAGSVSDNDCPATKCCICIAILYPRGPLAPGGHQNKPFAALSSVNPKRVFRQHLSQLCHPLPISQWKIAAPLGVHCG